MRMNIDLGTLCGGIFLAIPTQARSNADPAVTVCQATGLIALKQRESYISDLVLSMDSLAVSTAETKVEDVPVKTVILGEASIKHTTTPENAANHIASSVSEATKGRCF